VFIKYSLEVQTHQLSQETIYIYHWLVLEILTLLVMYNCNDVKIYKYFILVPVLSIYIIKH